MEKIESFKVDHTKLDPGMYISRIDGDITTYDMRVKKPNTVPLLTNREMHSFEHMFATMIRNSGISENVIYFGPMGCQTGFYLLVRNAVHEKVIDETKKSLNAILDYEGEIFGKSRIECGNYISLDLESAKRVALEYKAILVEIGEYSAAYRTV